MRARKRERELGEIYGELGWVLEEFVKLILRDRSFACFIVVGIELEDGEVLLGMLKKFRRNVDF